MENEPVLYSWRRMTMKYIRFSITATALFLVSLFQYLPFSLGQDVSTATGNAVESVDVDPLVIKLSVEEVRLDIVVLDNKGNPVTDLKASDFEVFQNGARQNILSGVYIDNQSDAAAQPFASRKTDVRKDTGKIPPLPTINPKREDAGRTIVFVIDDLTMSFEHGYYTKMALRNFVEKQMQPNDMVAILRTGYGSSALNMFLPDKRAVLSRIDALRLEAASANPADDGSDLYRVYDNQLSTLSYSLRALKDMPGRKVLIMLTTQPTLVVPTPMSMEVDFNALYDARFARLADDALRAGVVVNFLNIAGLDKKLIVGPEGPVIMGADASMSGFRYYCFQGNCQWTLDNGNQFRVVKQSSSRNAFNPLPAKTGGVIIEDSNFYLEGVGRETESLMKGYYLISYAPPRTTFSPGDKEIFHKIKVNVKRRNVKVYTRDGFYSRLENENDSSESAAHPLQDAIFSPFLHSDLNVNIAAGYLKDSGSGYFIYSWVHIDPKDMTIVETENGGARIDFETLCLTSDINGYVHDLQKEDYILNIDPEKKSENIAWIRKHGIRFAMRLPVKKPGHYTVRVAVQNTASGKVGSAYQFIEIPDLEKKRLALSSLFMVNSAEDLIWLLSAATKGIGESLFFPVFQSEELRSPALRTYAVGNSTQTPAMLYNADEKAIAGYEIEVQSFIYKDGKEIIRSNPRPVRSVSEWKFEGVPISTELMVDSSLPPGDYVLQIVITDKKNSKKQESNAVQTLSFTVVEK